MSMRVKRLVDDQFDDEPDIGFRYTEQPQFQPDYLSQQTKRRDA